MVQQHVVLFEHFGHGLVFAHVFGQAGREWSKLQIGPIHHIGHGHQPHQVHGADHLVELVWAQIALREQEFGHMRRAVVGHFQPHFVAILPLAQLGLHGGAQVGEIFFIHRELAVAREAELVAALHIHAGEELVHISMQNGGKQHETVPFAEFFRQFHHARQNARRLYHGHAGSAAESVFAGKRHHKVERLVEQAREGVRRVEPQRGEDGQQLAVEIAFNPGALLIRPLTARIEENALLAQRGNQLLVEQLVLLLN